MAARLSVLETASQERILNREEMERGWPGVISLNDIAAPCRKNNSGGKMGRAVFPGVGLGPVTVSSYCMSAKQPM